MNEDGLYFINGIEVLIDQIGGNSDGVLVGWYEITEPGWYVVFALALLPLGPYETKNEAIQGFRDYYDEK